jgi:hypothetical protein
VPPRRITRTWTKKPERVLRRQMPVIKNTPTRQAADSTRKEQEFEVNVAKGIESKLDDEIKGLSEGRQPV